LYGPSPTIHATGANASITIAPTGTGSLDMSSKKITSLADPSADSDAATKGYVDSVAEGLDVKGSVRATTTGALPSNTYNNGSSGVGATLTGSANGALAAQDGVTLTTNDRLLVKNESTAANNGIYVVTTVGDGSNPYVLTRSEDMDGSPSSEIPGAFAFVEEGTVNADSGWVCTTNAPVTMGTTAINFQQFSGAGSIVAGDGLTKTGNELSVNVDNVTTAISADAVVVKASANLTTPNIGVANGDSLTVTGNLDGVSGNFSGLVDVTGNIDGGNINTGGVVVATGNVSGGNITTGGVVSATGNVTGGNLISGAAITDGTYTSTNGVFTGVVSIDASGNVDGGNINSDAAISAATTIDATGNITGGNLTTAGITDTGSLTASTTITATGNITGGNLTTAGITDTGSLTASTTITATGNVTGGNIITGGLVDATGSITAGTTIDATGNITGGNLTTAGITDTGSLTASTTVDATGNITGGNLTTAGITDTGSLTASTTITATGNVTGGNLITSALVSGATGTFGNITVNTDSIDSAGSTITLNTDSSDVDVHIENSAGNSYFKADAGASTIVIGENGSQTTDATLKIATTDSIMIPVGTTLERPSTPATGMIRFNSTLDQFEHQHLNLRL
jgi:hypothetical protein